MYYTESVVNIQCIGVGGRQASDPMVRLAANLSFLFTETPFLERFEAAAEAGFRAVELAFPYDTPPAEIAARLRGSGLELVLLNTPPGSDAGELGVAALPGRETETQAGIRRALEYAEALGAPRIHMLAGVPPIGSAPESIDRLLVSNIVRAADLAAAAGLEITLEPLNARDRPGYHLQSCAHARRLIEAAGCENVRLQLDLYHCRFQESDLIAVIDREIDLLGHTQIANFPDRHEPTIVAMDYERVLAHLDEAGFDGYVGCEYVPAKGTLAGLRWAERYLSR